ncbi:uncharacterized protein LOC116412739 [Galleria mellonella]|uniref:Uncharacterized protein LOC116412739 n=1 Tax=Galleria mellonella TaxID=7137 RepID=A0A6J3BU98_GALME|nr:uncharacterized protein LOC116412739 [Galleria mellonella]
MLHVLIFLGITCCIIAANPVAISNRQTSLKDNFAQKLEYMDVKASENDLARILPDKAMLFLKVVKVIKGLVGHKVSVVSLAVGAIKWIISNAVVIAIGAIITIGFCKFTGKCSLSYEEYIPVAQLHTFVTPENLKIAERFLVTAMEKYNKKN